MGKCLSRPHAEVGSLQQPPAQPNEPATTSGAVASSPGKSGTPSSVLAAPPTVTQGPAQAGSTPPVTVQSTGMPARAHSQPGVPGRSSSSLGAGAEEPGSLNKLRDHPHLQNLASQGSIDSMQQVTPAGPLEPGTGSSNLGNMIDAFPDARANMSIPELNQELEDMAFIGQGASGDVYRGRWHGATVAIKYIVCQTADAQEAATNEAALGRLLGHPNVVQTFSCKTAVVDEAFYALLRTGLNLGPSQGGAHSQSGAADWPVQDEQQIIVHTGQNADLQDAASSDGDEPGQPGSVQVVVMPTFADNTIGGLPAVDGHLQQAHADDDQEQYYSGEGFGNPLGQPQSLLAIQEVLLRADAKIGYQLTQIIMEHCDKGSLLNAIQKGLFLPTSKWGARLALRALLRTAQEVAQGMWHIHQCNVVHGDLKPGNVLLKSSRADRRGFVAKVSDFGLSFISDRTTKDSKRWGTVSYMAPETFDGVLAKQSDVWSFGVTLWQMVTGDSPWRNLHPGQIIVGVQSGQLTLDWPPTVHPRLAKLGQACLQHERKARPLFNYIKLELSQIESLVRMDGAGGGGSPRGSPHPQLTSESGLQTISQGGSKPQAGRTGIASSTLPTTSPTLLPAPQPMLRHAQSQDHLRNPALDTATSLDEAGQPHSPLTLITTPQQRAGSMGGADRSWGSASSSKARSTLQLAVQQTASGIGNGALAAVSSGGITQWVVLHTSSDDLRQREGLSGGMVVRSKSMGMGVPPVLASTTQGTPSSAGLAGVPVPSMSRMGMLSRPQTAPDISGVVHGVVVEGRTSRLRDTVESTTHSVTNPAQAQSTDEHGIVANVQPSEAAVYGSSTGGATGGAGVGESKEVPSVSVQAVVCPWGHARCEAGHHAPRPSSPSSVGTAAEFSLTARGSFTRGNSGIAGSLGVTSSMDTFSLGVRPEQHVVWGVRGPGSDQSVGVATTSSSEQGSGKDRPLPDTLPGWNG